MDSQPNPVKNRSLELKWAREQIKSLKKKQVASFREKWFDSQDVMMALRISRRTLQKLRDRGLLPFIRLGGKLYYKAKDVAALLQNRYMKKRKTNSND